MQEQLKSKIYFGHIQHRRFEPKPHHFRYRLFMLYIDLDELDLIFSKHWLWSINRANWASFNEVDYLYDSQTAQEKSGLKHRVQSLLKARYEVTHQGPVRMLTHIRYAGYCFNPVTFYYCFNAKNQNVDFVLAQINNTPWNERYTYSFDNRKGELLNESKNRIEIDFEKSFHVSPFLPMVMKYFWSFLIPNENLHVYMKNTVKKSKFFDATLTLKGCEINTLILQKRSLLTP